MVFTAYNSHVNQTDHQPRLTASGRKTSYQTLALSRDFITKYNYPDNYGFNYGDTVEIYFRKDIIIEDTMNKRYCKRGDIWTESKLEAIKFGRHLGLLVRRKK
jgi:3D (Asp-Asp-Asp) domain-containing protein